MNDLFSQIHNIILTGDADEKCRAMHALSASLDRARIDKAITDDTSDSSQSKPVEILTPGYPTALELVAPRELKRRGIQSQEGRNILLHAVAHIEFNAINLALDAAYRFRNQPSNYYLDWLKIADDEARHFGLIRRYLNDNGCDYGDYKAHNGLWQMAVETQYDVVARMALVPRVLEARGLDVTPGIIKKFERVQDQKAVDILNVIYHDEITHVLVGSQWFFYHCKLRDLEPRSTFTKMVERYLHGELKGPFNTAARLQAGFDEIEMAALNTQFG